MKFGGRTKFGGKGKFGGDPLTLDPGHICNRMIAALSRFKLQGGTGFLKTLARLSGPLDDPTTWGQILQFGTPAMLVHYGGSTFPKVFGTLSGNVYEGESTFSVVCVANDYRSRLHRLEGRRRSRYEPGLDHMTRWALYYVGNELVRNGSRLQRARPISINYVAYQTLHFISIVSFAGADNVDLHDNIGSDRFERLGIVHTPLNNLDLFEDDNVTPRTNDPTSVAVGYAELKD
jgi:hypothetical protein